MVTENLLQNILDTDTSGKRPPEKKEKENYRPYSGAVGGGKKERKRNYRPYSRVDGAWGETWGWCPIG
jgi:hypothetical protein